MKPIVSTRVPLIADALVSLAKTIDPGGITVVDGAWPTTPESKLIVIGLGDADGEAFGVKQERQGLGGGRLETIETICGLSGWSGENEMPPLRLACGEMLDAIREKISADVTLGGVVDTAMLGPEMSWQQYLTNVGAVVSVGFSVSSKSSI